MAEPEESAPPGSGESPSRLHIRALPEIYAAPADGEERGPIRDGLLGIRPGELRRTALLMAYLFIASCVFVLGRTVRDAFFLSYYRSRVGELLPFMFIAYGAASAAVAVFYARASARIRRDRFVAGFALTAAASYLVVRALVPASPRWLYAVLYVWAEIVGNLTLVQFWSVANDLHDPRSAKRLFGIIGTGRTIGVLVCGLGAGSFVQQVRTENLLFVLAGLLVAIAGLVTVLTREYGAARGRASLPPPEPGALAAALRSGYVRSLAVVMLLGFVVVNIGDFQFKAAARLVHPTRDGIAHFMALFYATLGAIALVLQLVGTRWVLRRFGVAGGMLALPVAYFVANVGLLIWPSLQLATAVKIADNAFQFTIFDATLQLLYFPLSASTRDGVRSFLEAVAKPIGYGLAGATVLLLRRWWPPDTLVMIASQSWVVLPLAGGWIALIPAVRRRYLQTLERSLTRHEADAAEVTVNDAGTRQVLLRALRETSPRAVIYAFEQLVALDPPAARAAIAGLLERQEPSIRAAALRTVAALDVRELLGSVREALDDSDEAVSAAAAETYGALAAEECLPVLVTYVHSKRPRFQDAVLATLLRRGGLEGVLAAGRVVEAWLGSSDAPDRARAAALFGRPGIPGLGRVVRRLLRDPVAEVRLAALAAAGAVGDPGMADEVLEAMDDPAARDAAARALTRMGPGAIDAIGRALGSRGTARQSRLALPRVLAQMRDIAAYRKLLEHLDEPDEWIRQKVLASASRTRAAGGYEPLSTGAAHARMLREIDGVRMLREQYAHVRGVLALPLLDRWILERLRKGMVRVLRLGELAHPHAQVAAARDALFVHDDARRARAVEILENMLDLQVRARFVVELDAFVALRKSPLPAPRPQTGAEEAFVRQLVALPEPFARVMGLDASQFRSIRLPDGVVEELTRDEDPAVRELAALVVATFKSPAWQQTLGALRDDRDLRVRTYADYAFTTGRTGMDPGDEMYTTLEKVLFLQRVPLFADVAPESLVALARSAEVERHRGGETVYREGAAGDTLFFVIDGRVRVKPQAGVASIRGEGEVFGEMSLLDAAPRAEVVEVVEDATLMRISQEEFYDVMRDTPDLAEGVIRELVRRLRTARAAVDENGV